MEKIPTEILLQNLKDYYIQYGKAPTIKDFPLNTYRSRFGSWNKILEAADIPINKTGKGTRKYTTICSQCGIEFEKELRKKRTKNDFCSQSCSGTYYNAHKIHGYRRSKLEIYLEEQIRVTYPELELICNNSNAVGYELDFYFPELKFAIELNGIFHYEPIYGQDNFNKIEYRDQQKAFLCERQGIELCVIDISSISNLSQKHKDKYWNIVKSILISVLPRLSIAGGSDGN